MLLGSLIVSLQELILLSGISAMFFHLIGLHSQEELYLDKYVVYYITSVFNT
jgi:hypothetical protein